MARKTMVILIDDLDGTELADGEGITIEFAINGTEYLMDLGKKNAEKFHNSMEKYIAVATKSPSKRARRTGSRSATDPDPKAVRAWAASNGIKLSARGRVATDVVKQFQDAGN